MADALERITNLVALLMATRAPLTLEQIANELAGQYPTGDSAMRGAFERDKALLREIGVPLESEVLAGSDAGKTAYRIERAKYELADLRLEPGRAGCAGVRRGHRAPRRRHVRPAETRFLRHRAVADRGQRARSAGPAGVARCGGPPRRGDVHLSRHREGRAALLAVAPRALLVPDRLRARPRRGAHLPRRPHRGRRGGGRGRRLRTPGRLRPAGLLPLRPEGAGRGARCGGRGPGGRRHGRGGGARARRGGRGGARGPTAWSSWRWPVPTPMRSASWLFGLGVHAEVLGPPEVRQFVVTWLQATVAAGQGAA